MKISEQISSSVNIVDLISETVKLRPSSHGYVGLCPFHQEKTPSFHVYSDTQSYYCFGCHKGGNIFTYVMEHENVNFSEALRILADKAGIRLSKVNNIEDSRDILKLSAEFFAQSLKSSNMAMKYLEERSLSSSDITKFSLGYAPEAWDGLTVHLRKRGYSDKALVNSGLTVQCRGGMYDRFRGRIIFPVCDITGRIIAFGGRIIAGEGAKYINSPESETYRKRKNLYLLDMARSAIRERKRSILCEGYMDAIRLHKVGFSESVASLGTSLTAEQAELLSRYADRCYICYDSDTAGQNAALRGMYILQSHGLDVYVIRLPEGKDPDEYLLKHGAEDFEVLITEAKPLVLAHIEALSSHLNDPLTRKRAVKELFSSLVTLRAGEVLEYKSQLCEATRLTPEDIDRMLVTKAVEMPEERDEHEAGPEAVANDISPECGLCALLMRGESLRLKITCEEIMKIVPDGEVRELALSILNEDVRMLSELWLETGDTEKFSMLQRGEELCRQLKGLTDEEKFTEICKALKRRATERRISEIRAQPLTEGSYKELSMLYHEREKYSR